MTRVRVVRRGAWLALAAATACAAAPGMPDPPASHPASPHAKEAAVVPRPATLALGRDAEPAPAGLPTDGKR